MPKCPICSKIQNMLKSRGTHNILQGDDHIHMAKTAKAPPGFYSASEAIKKLGVPRSTFYDLVEKGIIKKAVQPGRSDAYYLRAAVDDLVKARELFTLQY